jgi:hypothetical protein
MLRVYVSGQVSKGPGALVAQENPRPVPLIKTYEICVGDHERIKANTHALGNFTVLQSMQISRHISSPCSHETGSRCREVCPVPQPVQSSTRNDAKSEVEAATQLGTMQKAACSSMFRIVGYR